MTSVALALMQEVWRVGGIIRLEGATIRLSAPAAAAGPAADTTATA